VGDPLLTSAENVAPFANTVFPPFNIPGLKPGAIVPPACTVMVFALLIVPVPPKVPPDATVTLLAMKPLMFSRPPATVVTPEYVLAPDDSVAVPLPAFVTLPAPLMTLETVMLLGLASNVSALPALLTAPVSVNAPVPPDRIVPPPVPLIVIGRLTVPPTPV
jgi:hypothetical protein